MTHVVSGKIRKAPFTKDGCGADGQSKMYSVELSEVVKDYRSGEKSYTNYKAMFFAKTPAAMDYYDKAFAEGSFVVVSCDKLKVEQREHNGNTYITLQMDNARLDGANYPETQRPQHNQRQQRPVQHQPYGNQRPAYNEPPMDFDDDIPFAPIGLQHKAVINCM